MRKLANRSLEQEQMDAPGIDPDVYAKVLADLARVNRWTLTARPISGFLGRATRGLRAFSLLDVGFGHGDMLRAVARWAARRGIAARLVGVDLNPLSETVARRATPATFGIDFRTGDYRDQRDGFDFIVSSQVAHHMSMADLQGFIRFMETHAARGWLINDLERHIISHKAFPLLARLMGVHRIVREDGTLSIARSFRAREWAAVLENAGIAPGTVHVRRHLPFRLSVQRIFSPTPPV